MGAAKGGHEGIVDILIEAKLDVNDADDVGFYTLLVVVVVVILLLLAIVVLL